MGPLGGFERERTLGYISRLPSPIASGPGGATVHHRTANLPLPGMDHIRIRGARTHNLRNVNLDIPRDRLVVITGLSGSGKSSLAFDTLYAEGQRRYVESLSAYARQFLQLMEKPDVDLIEGLSPAISIEQKATSPQPALDGRHGHRDPRLPAPALRARRRARTARSTAWRSRRRACRRWSTTCCRLPEDTRVMVLAPLVVGRKGEQAELFEELRAQGFVRLRIDGEVHEIDAAAEARAQPQAHDRGRGRPPEGRGRTPSSASRSPSRRRCGTPTGGRVAVEMDSRAASTCSPRSSPARCAATRCPSSSRGSSRSTTRWAPARAATAWAQVTFFDPKRVVAFPHLSLAGGRDPRLGPAQPVLLLDAAVARAALRLRRRDARSRSCPSARRR